MQRYQNRVAVITGGTSGIGLAAASRLLEEGARVLVGGRSQSRGESALNHLDSDRADFLATDVTRPVQIQALMQRAVDRWGRLDLLVNGAGQVVPGHLENLDVKHWNRLIDINLNGVFHGCQAAIAHLEKTVAEGLARNAAIVNVASISAVGGDNGMPAYNAAKAGVLNLSRSLALELAHRRIRVNVVSPGAVDTPMSDTVTGSSGLLAAYQTAIPLGRFGEPDEVAAAVAFLGAEEAGYITGANLLVDGGLSAQSGLPNLMRLMDQSRP